MIRGVLFFVIFYFSPVSVFGYRCDRRPYGATTQSTASDGRFRLTVVGAEGVYIPEQLYVVKIRTNDNEARFIYFIISAEGDMKPDPRNPRRLISHLAGEVRPQDFGTAKFSDRCPNSVEQVISNLKSSVEVYWQAPPSGNGCVTLRAMVAENDDLWFEDGPPLTQKLCEDSRQPDDVSPQLNYECSICDDAKYEISFRGIWSRNTHPLHFPENPKLPRYSSFVGASHAADYILWAPGTLASDGLKELAENADSSKLEAEIIEKIGDGIRTLIKGKGHGYRKMNRTSYSYFRADKANHLLSTVVAIYPSPDWFLGVARFELCLEDNTWLKERELNLYPWDAGTDSGVSYESPNIPTVPQDAVKRVQMSSYDRNSPFYETDMKDMLPFGKMQIKLVKTYHRNCEEAAEGETPGPDKDGDGEDRQEPEEPSSENPIQPDPESQDNCPVSQWQPWDCEGKCVDGKREGYRRVDRFHIVNGVVVDDTKPSYKKLVPKECLNKYKMSSTEECTEDCSSDEERNTAVERRIGNPIAPGHPWVSKKRDLPKEIVSLE
ncbi:spondin-1-like isoform X2 [Hyposmocoma kahamanoa]|uniref:spondin-1-like isoform X2 n=1 Tax=Hyposmocoma kahamanoa TaxID=1477025 RepID=UPI000E6D98BD|nr:spondin-1-like isoform X2 [Hyposmocoma kahamanoa]